MKAKRVLCMLAAILLVVAMMLMFLTGCNRQVIDTTFSYDNAILALPDGSVISGKIESWKDYDDGDQIQVKIDGTTYLVHSVNIVLINPQQDLCSIDGAGIFAGCYFGEGWYGPSPFSFLRSSDVLRKRKLDHGRTRS